MYQQYDVDIVLPACNFIENKSPAEYFSTEFFEFSQPATLFSAEIFACEF